jgi:hypothetical protein
MLSGYAAMLAKRNAPAEATKTEAFRADLMPVPAVIPIAKAKSSHPLNWAALRVWKPNSRVNASNVSAPVTNHASAGITDFGNQGFSLAVYAMK